ncbi:uncharacterized protein ACA1_235720 [Acanthamoeba castellanii str. Neff]|uniref:Uncharacterized protein n=1 Tax=Acanthamoeba castellanii (strain ATCC 30010 / Neff) TaxID=1257118 RepID=L8H0L7_ACACF|nr:uncharacterized protein ACA1_235720 [Acanthamoeba castellanii str. Neff]ELR19034.1 hypothetical protein ACA1_235720 [Acanthamoeba castellanii str. Neff]
MGRMLRRQVSTPVLPTQIRAGAPVPAGVSDRSTVQQEPWKREINDLWAKQLAMMREINTLKNELGRREAARQREILGLRQEIDGLRGEVFRIRQMKGLQPASSENLLPTNAPKAPEADPTTLPAAATPAKAAAVPSEDAATTPQPKVAPGDAPAQASVLLPPPASPTRHSPKAAATVSITAP